MDTARSTDPRRGSILRREALERFRKQQHEPNNHQPHQDPRTSGNEGKGRQDGRGVKGATSSEVQSSRAIAESIMNGRQTWGGGKDLSHGLSLLTR